MISQNGKVQILLVDASQTFIDAVTKYLQRYDSLQVVGVAHSVTDMMHMAQTLRPQVILLDLSLPGGGSLAMIPDLRGVLPDVGIVVLTLLDSDPYRQAAFAVGVDGFVSKTSLSQHLIGAIQRLRCCPDTFIEHEHVEGETDVAI